MSGKKTKAARKAGTRPDKQQAKSKIIAKKKTSKKVFWISFTLCVLVIVVIAVISFINRDTSSNDTAGAELFPYSEGIDESGFWKDTAALDHVALLDYQSFPIPQDIHDISDDAVQSEVYNLMRSFYSEPIQVTDRAVIDGDTVNIDYVGSVDGVEFSGGSTGGEGTEVIAGSLDYIDDFLIQIIGHMPGETFNVEVTFPDVYDNNPDLAGKDALFVTTINYILEYTAEEDYDLSDSFVEENLTADYGWTTVVEMEEGLREDLQKAAIANYVREYMANDLTFYEWPDAITTYQEELIAFQEKDMLDYYQSLADDYEMDLDTLLQSFVGVSGTDELIEQNRNSIQQDLKRSLAVQAIAEDAGIAVSDEDMEQYLPDYTYYEETYGMPWLKQYVLGQKVLDYVIENAVLT